MAQNELEHAENGPGDEIRRRLKEERNRLDMTQEAVAQACGAPVSTYQKWENGPNELPREVRAALTSIGMDVVYIEFGFHKENAKESAEKEELRIRLDETRNLIRERMRTAPDGREKIQGGAAGAHGPTAPTGVGERNAK